jgi:hypothetical protein
MIQVYIEHDVFIKTSASFTPEVNEFADIYIVGDTYDENVRETAEFWDLETVEDFPSARDTDADVIFKVTDGIDDTTRHYRIERKVVWYIDVHSKSAIDNLAESIQQKVEWGESVKSPSGVPVDNTRKESNPKDAIGCLKTPAHVVPPRVLAEVGLALLEGAMKYSSYNYRAAGVRASVYFDSVSRHLNSFWEGEDIDKDSGLSHVTKAISALIVLRDSMIGGNWTDDRPPAGNIDYEELNKKAAAIIDKYKHLNMQPHTQKGIS